MAKIIFILLKISLDFWSIMPYYFNEIKNDFKSIKDFHEKQGVESKTISRLFGCL